MSIKYKDISYARDKLVETLVRYKGEPVIVGNIDARGQALVYPIVGVRDGLNVDYKELELEPVPLGNVNFAGGVAYASRISKRRDWRQGLRANNLYVSMVVRNHGRAAVRYNSPEFVNTIIGNYPSIKTCVESVICGEAYGMAFSRYFSVGEDDGDGNRCRLFFKREFVGYVNIGEDKETLTTELIDRFKYLSEMLIEEMKNG